MSTTLDPHEIEGHARAILDEVRAMLASTFALAAWGRLLVELAPDDAGALRVADLVVEEIVGDEAAVDAAFGGLGVRASLPALTQATITLCELAGVEAAAVGGGTFVRVDGAEGRLGVAFLPGCVRAPSASLDARRAALTAWMTERNAVLRSLHGVGDDARVEADLRETTARIVRGGATVAVAEPTVLGSFSRARRSWVWGAHNPTLEPAARARSAALLDGVGDRTAWELGTPGFTTDEPTAWLLAALVAFEHDLAGVARIDAGPDGFVLLGLGGVRAP